MMKRVEEGKKLQFKKFSSANADQKSPGSVWGSS